MKNKTTITLLFSTLCCILCSGQKSNSKTFSSQKVVIDTLFQDNISIRSLTIEGNTIWFAADQNRFGYYELSKKEKSIKTFPNQHNKTEFRSCAITPSHFFALSIASPALLYKIDKNNLTSHLVYQNTNEKTFFDSLQFWNAKEGIALGDPINNHFSIIITKDGGNTWQELPKEIFPKNEDDEGAFAASNTNIVIQGNHTWMVSGGKKARVFYSPNKGKSWQAFETPIVQGKTMTGIFSAAFYDSKTGCIAGGDYENPKQNSGNKALTSDGGKTWQLVAENSGPGYISCVQFIPKSKGKALLTVGATGIHYSTDGGKSWQQISADTSLYTVRFLNSKTAIAAGKNKMIRIFFQ